MRPSPDSSRVIAVIGGGQVGTYHARQLLKGVRSGRLAGERLLLVDRDARCRAFRELGGQPEVVTETADWSQFLREWLPRASDGDQLVPTPWAPHLLSEWLAGAVGARSTAPPRGWRLPYEVGVGDTLYLSAAAWACPAIIRPALVQVKSYPQWTMLSSIQPYVNTFGSRDRWLEVYLCTNNSQIYLNQETHLWPPSDFMYVGDVRALRAGRNYCSLFLCFVYCF